MTKSLIGLLWVVAFQFATAVQAGSISGNVYEDHNRNGLMDAGEPPLRGVPINLLGANGSEQRFTLTDQNGHYEFPGLPDGHYALSIREADNYRHSLPDQGAESAPVPGFPFGRPRYATMPGLVGNLAGAAAAGIPFRHVGLGDSIGFGFNLCDSPFGDNGYIEPTTARLAATTAGELFADKQAVLGRETADLLIPGIGPESSTKYNDVFYVKDTGAPLVSISIGGNDFLAAEGGGDAQIAAKLVTARRNLQEIFSTLVTEIPYANIEINTVYDNLEGNDPLHNVWVPIWNQMLRETAWAQERRVTIAEIYPEYAHREGSIVLGQPGLICDFFGLDEIHPTQSGYDVHEEKLWQSWGGVTLANGSSRTDFNIGFLRVTGRLTPNAFNDITGNTSNPERALVADGLGALVPPDNSELQVFDFNVILPPTLVLAQSVVKVRYRTTGAPLDDYYRFEASLDGSFSPPGTGPSDWNSIIPIVGASGNDGSLHLAYPDQPVYRVVSAPLYKGSPITGAGTLNLNDVRSLSVRLVTTSVGAADAFSVDWDAVILEGYTMPAPLVSTAAAPIIDARAVIAAALEAETEPDTTLVASLEADLKPGDAALLKPLLKAGVPTLRATALRLLSQTPGIDASSSITVAAGDPDVVVRRTAARAATTLTEDTRRALLTNLARDEDRVVRRLAVRGLAELKASETILVDILGRDPDMSVRIEAAAGLLAQGDPAGVAILLDALVMQPPSARAREALTGHAGLYRALIDGLGDVQPEKRAWAARLLGQKGLLPEDILAQLRGLLSDSNLGVQAASADALSRSGDPQALPVLMKLAEDKALQSDIAQALGRYQDADAHQALYRMASSPAVTVTARIIAARQLALYASAAEIPLLQELQKSDNNRITRLALAGLQRLQTNGETE